MIEVLLNSEHYYDKKYKGKIEKVGELFEIEEGVLQKRPNATSPSKSF